MTDRQNFAADIVSAIKAKGFSAEVLKPSPYFPVLMVKGKVFTLSPYAFYDAADDVAQKLVNTHG